MANEGTKVECKISPTVAGKLIATYEGLADIVETQYDERFTVWFGSVLIVCSADEFQRLDEGGDGFLQLADGRIGDVHFMGGNAARAAALDDFIATSEHQLVYFVGMTPLQQAG